MKWRKNVVRKGEPTIEDLCKPLSAKIQPKSALWTNDHQKRTQEEAEYRQRVATTAKGNRGIDRRSKAKGK
jgi:hypothetical protein